MEPATTIIAKLGGPTSVATRIGRHRTRVSKWQVSREKGGTGGMIPMKDVPALLAFAKELNVEMCADDFLPQEATTK